MAAPLLSPLCLTAVHVLTAVQKLLTLNDLGTGFILGIL